MLAGRLAELVPLYDVVKADGAVASGDVALRQKLARLLDLANKFKTFFKKKYILQM